MPAPLPLCSKKSGRNIKKMFGKEDKKEVRRKVHKAKKLMRDEDKRLVILPAVSLFQNSRFRFIIKSLSALFLDFGTPEDISRFSFLQLCNFRGTDD